ncbi:MAG: preprotein translocase subunit SecG [Chitinivibrionales bacterium]|nr:preprotein translocase subunit SecG [Chitinivibrionales bacterium]
MLFAITLVIFVIVCIILCLLVLVQSDKGGGISSAIGGNLANASTLLGTQDTANILTRGTTIFATSYIVLCMVLSLLLGRVVVTEQKSELKKRAETQSFSPSSVLQEGLPLEQGAPGKPTSGTTSGGSSEATTAPGSGSATNALPAPSTTPQAGQSASPGDIKDKKK